MAWDGRRANPNPESLKDQVRISWELSGAPDQAQHPFRHGNHPGGWSDLQSMATSKSVRRARAASGRKPGVAQPVISLYQITLILVVAAGCALIAYARIVGG